MKHLLPKILFIAFGMTFCSGLFLFAYAATLPKILTPQGYVSIKEIKIGDPVVAYDMATGQKITNTVERIDIVSRPPATFYLVNGTYKLWENQSVWANDHVVHAFELNIGDILYNENFEPITIVTIEVLTRERKFAQFVISGNHNYIMDGLLVHNASRYWVGGGSSANWDATANTNWSATSGGANNASVPTSADDVFFDGVGGGASNSTLSAGITIRSLDMTGYTNTLTHNENITLSIGDATAGAGNNALIFGGLTYTLGSATTSAISFTSTSATAQNVNGNNKTMGNVTFNGSGGSWKLTGILTTGATTTVTLSQGKLDTNGQTVTIGKFDSSNSNTRTLDLSAGLAIITVSGTGTSWNLATTTNLTFSGGSSSIDVSGQGATFAGGGLTYGTVTPTGSGTQIITGANTFGTLTRTGTAVKTDVLQLNANQTVSSTLNLNGNSTTNRLLIRSDTLGTARTITSNATISSITNADFRDITGAGTMSWDLSGITGNSGDCLGNSGITFTTAAAQTWSGTSGGNWSANAWTSRVPLCQDNATISAAFSASQTVTADMPRLGKSVDWTGATGSPTFSINSTSNTIYGSLTLISGLTLTTGQTLTFEGRGAFTFTSAGKTFGAVTVQMVGGTLTLQDNLALSSTSTFTLNNGTLAANGKDVTAGAFDSSNSNTRTITMGAGTWTVNGTGTVWNLATITNLTLNENTSVLVVSDTSATAKTFAGGGETYYTATFSGDNITVSGANTFSTLNLNTAGLTNGLKLTAGTTQTVTTFASNGSSGSLAKLVSTSAGSAATISKVSGNVCEDYMSIQDSTATGGAGWYAGANSTNVSGNTGWNFTICPISIGGTVYSDEGTTNIGANITVAISINGAAAAATDDTDASGVYSISAVVSANDVLTLYVDGETQKGVTVTKGTGSDQTGVHIFQDRLITRCDNSCSLTNANINTADGNADADITAIISSASDTAVTTASGKSLYIPASHTFAPGGTLSIGGHFVNVGTFTHGSSTVTLTGTSSYNFYPSTSTFYNVTVNGSGGTYTLKDSITIANDFTITAGTFSVSGGGSCSLEGCTMTVTGNWSNSATFTAGTGLTSTVTFNATDSGNTITSNGASGAFYNLTFNGVGGTWTLQDATTVSNVLTITNGTLSGGSVTLTLSGTTGTPFSNSGTFTASTGTVSYTGNRISGNTTITNVTYYNLTVNNSSETYVLAANTTVSNNLTITAGTLDTVSGSNYSLNVAGNWSNSGTFTARSGTVTLDGTDQTVTGTTTFYNLTKQETTNNGADQTLTFTASTTYTVSNTFNLDGLDSNDELKLVSSSAGTKFTLDLTSAATATYLDVKDSQTSTSSATCNNCTNAGGNDDGEAVPHWIFGTATLDQKHFRFYNDSAVPAGLNNANPYAAEDANYNIGLNTTFRLRIEVANTAASSGNLTPRLEFKEDSGSWTQITTGSNNVRLSNSTNFADGAATTTRLTAVGTFAAGEGKDTGSDATLLSLTNNYYTEHEYSLILQSGASGKSYQFRITNAGTALDTYTVTPAINTPDATPPTASGFNPATSATIRTATPTITFNLDEAGDCKASTTNASYSAMSGADCSGDGSSAGSCVMPSLGSNGSKTIYFACQDVWGNQDSSSTTDSVTYTLTLSSGLTPSFTLKGVLKFMGSVIFK